MVRRLVILLALTTLSAIAFACGGDATPTPTSTIIPTQTPTTRPTPTPIRQVDLAITIEVCREDISRLAPTCTEGRTEDSKIPEIDYFVTVHVTRDGR